MALDKKAAAAKAKDSAQAEALDAFLKDVNKVPEFAGAVRRLSDGGLRIPVASTGAISLDYAIGAGGFPYGRIIELFGAEGGGKTTLALSVAASVQKDGGIVGLVDSENGFNPELAANLGIDPDRFIVFQPMSGEEAIDMVERMCQSKAFNMIIVDSVAAMTPKAELNAEVEQQTMGLHARLMSKFMRRVNSQVRDAEVMLVLINQVRKNIGGYVAFDESTGGKAIKFYSSLRVEVKSNASSKLTRGSEAYGQTVTATVKKNRMGAPFKVATFDLIYGKGLDGMGSLLEVAEGLGVITRKGAYYTEAASGLQFSEVVDGKEKKIAGKDNVKELLRRDAELFERIYSAVKAGMDKNMIEAPEVDETEHVSFDEQDDNRED